VKKRQVIDEAGASLSDAVIAPLAAWQNRARQFLNMRA
jgi:hypothetical protein